MPQLPSVAVSTAPSIGSLKLGQPVPLSNFNFDSNNGWAHAAHENLPGPLFLQQRTTARRLGSMQTHHVILLLRQDLAPFSIAVVTG
jgi:hypothetical protein